LPSIRLISTGENWAEKRVRKHMGIIVRRWGGEDRRIQLKAPARQKSLLLIKKGSFCSEKEEEISLKKKRKACFIASKHWEKGYTSAGKEGK